MTRRPDETPTLPALRIAAAIAIALVAIVAVPSAVGLGLAEDKGDTAPDEAKVEQQRVQIHKEIATIQRHTWAGEYYEGDGLGANIRMSLAPNAGVAATWHGCMGLYGANRGKVVMRDGELRFEYEQPNRQGFGGFPDALRPVRWGARRYMIPNDKRIAFVNAINHRYDPLAFLDALPLSRVRSLHVAGHFDEAMDLKVDTHGTDVIEPVWALLGEVYRRLGPVPCVLERDFNLPPLPALLREVQRIRQLQQDCRQPRAEMAG